MMTNTSTPSSPSTGISTSQINSQGEVTSTGFHQGTSPTTNTSQSVGTPAGTPTATTSILPTSNSSNATTNATALSQYSERQMKSNLLIS